MPFVQITWCVRDARTDSPQRSRAQVAESVSQCGNAAGGCRRRNKSDRLRQGERDEPAERRRPRCAGVPECRAARADAARAPGFGESVDAFPQPKGYSVRAQSRPTRGTHPLYHRQTRFSRAIRAIPRRSASAPTIRPRDRRPRERALRGEGDIIASQVQGAVVNARGYAF